MEKSIRDAEAAVAKSKEVQREEKESNEVPIGTGIFTHLSLLSLLMIWIDLSPNSDRDRRTHHSTVEHFNQICDIRVNSRFDP